MSVQNMPKISKMSKQRLLHKTDISEKEVKDIAVEKISEDVYTVTFETNNSLTMISTSKKQVTILKQKLNSMEAL